MRVPVISTTRIATDLHPEAPPCRIAGVDSEALMMAVRDTLAISNGSACTSARYKSSHVLASIQVAPERIGTAIRLSWGHAVKSPSDVQGACCVAPLKAAVEHLRS